MKIKSFIFNTLAIIIILLFPSCERTEIFSKMNEIMNSMNSNSAITDYKFLSSINPALSTDAVSNINETDKTITLTVPFGTDVTSLIATFTTNGETIEVNSLIQESGLTSNNFTNPVTYTVTAEDQSFSNYTITINISPSDAKSFTQFQFLSSLNASLSENVTGTIDENNKMIYVIVPYDADPSYLTANFSITGAQVEVDTVIQESGVSKNNFLNPVTYTVIAEDTTSVNYTVNVQVELSPEKDITSFRFLASDNPALSKDVIATIHATTNSIDFEVVNGTDVTSLVAHFSTTGQDVQISGVSQSSSATPNDFTGPVTYRVIAGDTTTVDYIVTANFVMGSDNFDSGDLSAWLYGSGSATGTIVSPGANGSDNCLYLEGSSQHDEGIYTLYPATMPTYISYYIKFTSTSSAHAYVTAMDAAGNYIFFIWAMSPGIYGTSSSVSVPYSVGEWYFIEIKNINFATRRFDFYVNGVLEYGNQTFRGAATELSRINFYNYMSSDNAYYDQLIVR